jgi:integron integrase
MLIEGMAAFRIRHPAPPWQVRDGDEVLPASPRPLDGIRAAIRARHYSRRTEAAYTHWIRRFVLFHGKRHPMDMGEVEITAFLTHLAVRAKVSASTQNQALSALLFLYREVLRRDLEWLDGIVRAKRPTRLPVVLSRREVGVLLAELRGTTWLMASLLYGSGLRLLECCHLRVKDLDFDRGEITVRDGKGRKDRGTIFPDRLHRPLAAHLERVRRLHENDLEEGSGSVELPAALERKYARAPWDWG